MRTYFILVFIVLAHVSFAQTKFEVSYEIMKEYEGLYQYVNNSTLKIAASPKDTVVYAIINDSKYKLVPTGKDLFANMSSEQVRFIRSQSGAISGYAYNNDTFRLLSKDVFFPTTMWYPRVPSATKFAYSYQQPRETRDGLKTGPLNNSGLSRSLLTEMMEKIVDGIYPNIHSVLILKDGRLVFEEYFYEYAHDSLHELRSATKSFISALVGIAIDKGFIGSKNETVVSKFPEYDFNNMTDAKKKVTIEHLLTNQSGLDCDIANDKAEGNEMKMGYSEDWVKYTLDLPMVESPGGKGMYCSGNVIVAGRIIEKATGLALPDFARQNLFSPLGIKKFKWKFKPDPSSAETFCQLYLSPRDMAKFALLFLNQGKWNGKQVISREWVLQSLSKHSTVQNVDYGYLWWIKYLDADGKRWYGKAAQGNGGQRIFIWEELNLVAVITGGSYNTQSSSDELIRKYILPAYNKK